MNVSVNVSEELYRKAMEIAAAENIPVDVLFASAFEERLLEFERLKEKSCRGSYEKFLRVMSKVLPSSRPSMTASDVLFTRNGAVVVLEPDFQPQRHNRTIFRVARHFGTVRAAEPELVSGCHLQERRALVISKHAIEKFPTAGHLLVFLSREPVPWVLNFVIVFKQVGTHFQQ